MSTIRQTIESALDPSIVRSYSAYIGGVVEALEEREAEALDTLRAYAEEQGVSSHEVDSLFVSAGLVEPEPEPEAVNIEPQSVEAMLASIQEVLGEMKDRLDNAARQASRHGISF